MTGIAKTAIDAPPGEENFLGSPMAQWLAIAPTGRANVYRLQFREHHIGNPWIRALHGGAVGSLIEVAAELAYGKLRPGARIELQSSAIDYVRVTKAADLFARVDVLREGRRLSFVDVWCWQDAEDTPVARGSCTLRILDGEKS